jgi:DNA polymerase-1
MKVEGLFQELGLRRLSEVFAKLLGDLAPPAEPVHLATDNYRTIDSLESLDSLVAELKSAATIAIDTETTSTRPRDAQLVGISLCWELGRAAYIPILSPSSDAKLPLNAVRERLAPLLANTSIAWSGQNIKFDAILLRRFEMPIANVRFDTMVADYLLDAGGRNHDLGDISKRWLGLTTISIESLIGSGRDQITMDRVPLERIASYACEDVDLPWRLQPPMMERLEAENLGRVMHDLEIPLIQVLADMEYAGVRVDVNRLSELRAQFQVQIDQLRNEIMEIAGEVFNPDSPKQLATILFGRFHLRVVKKTKTGPSTDAEVLEELAAEHPLPAKIVEYRQLVKLLNTYIDALPRLISPETGRVHTSFRQDTAATGRLSSVEPNLQNIPVRTAEGRSIRSAFIPGNPDLQFLTADYSQIELRVLAHYCGDANLRRAFEEDIDIHTSVAAEVHGVAITDVSAAMRRSAKAVSFGILYGQSPFGLAKGLGISRSEASEFIDRYFARYPGVRDFIATTLIECRKNGFVKTMSGRKRYLRGIRNFETLPENKKKQLLEPERMAVNTVIQGSAADMIKLAMISISKQLAGAKWSATMLLQIHDELIFEVQREETDRLASLVRSEMVGVMPLSVPLKVDVKVGDNWAECEAL